MSNLSFCRHLLKFTAAVCIIFTAGCTTIYNPATRQRETYFISEQAEIAMGKNLALKVMSDYPMFGDEGTLAYVREVGYGAARVSDRNNLKYDFNVIDSDELNAFALPGGYIFVNRGLVQRTSRDELAFVLSHEIGHVAARHSLKRMQVALGVGLVMDLAFSKPQYSDLRQAINIVYQAVSSGYSRQDELLADSLGVTYSARAGYDPNASISMMDKLKTESGQSKFVFFSSHPPVETRIKNLRAVIQSLGRAR